MIPVYTALHCIDDARRICQISNTPPCYEPVTRCRLMFRLNRGSSRRSSTRHIPWLGVVNGRCHEREEISVAGLGWCELFLSSHNPTIERREICFQNTEWWKWPSHATTGRHCRATNSSMLNWSIRSVEWYICLQRWEWKLFRALAGEVYRTFTTPWISMLPLAEVPGCVLY